MKKMKQKIKNPKGYNMSKLEWCLCCFVIPFLFFVATILRLFTTEKKALDFMKDIDLID
jgi:hypothetical protein